MRPLNYDIFQTDLGWVGIIASELGIQRLSLRPSPQQVTEELDTHISKAIQSEDKLSAFRSKLTAYLSGITSTTDTLQDIPLDLRGTPAFFNAAWVACRRIPVGERRSYQWLAQEAGNHKAVRAAGQAMARNPVPLLIPCHRVVGSSGKLHGFRGGIDLKAKLLQLEHSEHSR